MTAPATVTPTGYRQRPTNLVDQTDPNASGGAQGDSSSEPSVTTITANGVDRTITAFNKSPSGGNQNISYASTTDFSSFQRGDMQHSGYVLATDPWLEENPYNGGMQPLRVYCSGILFNGTGTRPQDAPSAVALWHMDPTDNGTFSAPAIVDSRSGGGFLLDKPAMAVSWYNGSLGDVYVAYTSFDYVSYNPQTQVTGNTAIILARSTDGGATFPQKTVIAYGGPDGSGAVVTGAQVAVNVRNGDVYVSWVNRAGSLAFAISHDQAVSFSTFETIAPIYTPKNTLGSFYHTRADVYPYMKYCWIDDTVRIVWHDGPTFFTTGLDVFYAYRDAGGWHSSGAPVTQLTAYSEIMPAFDYNSAGDNIVTYYAYPTDNDPAGYYRAFATRLSWSGLRMEADIPLGGVSNTTQVLGDYQGAWDWHFLDGSRSTTAAWTGNPSFREDIYLSKISY